MARFSFDDDYWLAVHLWISNVEDHEFLQRCCFKVKSSPPSVKDHDTLEYIYQLKFVNLTMLYWRYYLKVLKVCTNANLMMRMGLPLSVSWRILVRKPHIFLNGSFVDRWKHSPPKLMMTCWSCLQQQANIGKIPCNDPQNSKS